MATFPAAIVTITSCPVDGIHMARNEMFLKSTRICECGAAIDVHPAGLSDPLAYMKFIVFGRKIRGGQNGPNATLKGWWTLTRA